VFSHVTAEDVAPTTAAVVDLLVHAAEPWVAYRALVDLVGADAAGAEARAAYARMRDDPLVAELIATLDAWPAAPLTRAYDPKDALWKLAILADFGLQRDDSRIAAIAERLFAAQADDGGFLHGGFDHTRTWDTRAYICIDHVQTYALACFGYLGDSRLERAYAHVVAWQRRDGGWHPNRDALPGAPRAGEPSCPFGTVNVLRALSVHPEYRNGEEARRAAEYLLDCWQRRAEPYRPVGFGIGATWDKLQYPFVQYQRLKTMDTLARVPGVRADPRFGEQLAELESRRRPDGLWAAEAINKPYAAFDFGQKKAPSPWISLLAQRILA
jgi:hypothetical protein